MINLIASKLSIIIAILAMCGWLLAPVCDTNFLQPFNRTLLWSDKIKETAEKEFVINNSSNILRNSLNGDKNITLHNHKLAHNSSPAAFNLNLWQLKKTLSEADEIAVNDTIRRPVLDENVEIHNDVLYGINKSNQENNFNNIEKQPTLSLSNIKLVNSSSFSPSSPGATLAGTKPTNSTSTASSSSSSSYFERVEMHESLTRSKHEKLLLHRKKRYLLFPEGSSFQLVFDLIIPIVDYTNFAIMGITCAVAWELPSKPPSEIIENFRTKLNDGTFGLSRRNDSTQQPLVYINSERTEQQAAENEKSWREGVAIVHNQHHHPQLSATTATTSGREHFLTNAPNPSLLQPSSKFNNNNYLQQTKIQQPPTFSYGQQPQRRKQWHGYDYETFDTNQRKTLYANDKRKGAIHQNDFHPYTNKHIYQIDHRQPASKWSFQNWQQKVYQQPQQTNNFNSDEGDYWHKGNWWELNANRIEKHWKKNQPKWFKYQEKPLENFQTSMSSKRTSRNRKILFKPLKHRIYPIFGKRRRRRSFGDHQAYSLKEDDYLFKKLLDIHTKEHLQTRQKLYGKIEKLYETRGQNGTACVLRALCETERIHLNSHYNEAPQSFVVELLRSIFALPKAELSNSKESLLQIDNRYVNAVLQAHDVTQSCSQQYDDCEYSITYDT